MLILKHFFYNLCVILFLVYKQSVIHIKIYFIDCINKYLPFLLYTPPLLYFKGMIANTVVIVHMSFEIKKMGGLLRFGVFLLSTRWKNYRISWNRFLWNFFMNHRLSWLLWVLFQYSGIVGFLIMPMFRNTARNPFISFIVRVTHFLVLENRERTLFLMWVRAYLKKICIYKLWIYFLYHIHG